VLRLVKKKPADPILRFRPRYCVIVHSFCALLAKAYRALAVNDYNEAFDAYFLIGVSGSSKRIELFDTAVLTELFDGKGADKNASDY